MNWGNEFLQWLASDEGWRVMSGAIIPALAILVAGLIAALVARGAVRRLITLHRQDALTAAVSGFVLAGRKAAHWHELGEIERVQLEHLIAESETRIRLLPISGSNLAATWASHQLESMKRDSSGFRFQALQTLGDYRDRLIDWSEKPRSAKKLFAADLEQWSSDESLEYRPSSPIDAAQEVEPESAWVSSPSTIDDRTTLTPEPPSSVAVHTGTMPLIITHPRPASSVRERVLPGSA